MDRGDRVQRVTVFSSWSRLSAQLCAEGPWARLGSGTRRQTPAVLFSCCADSEGGAAAS